MKCRRIAKLCVMLAAILALSSELEMVASANEDCTAIPSAVTDWDPDSFECSSVYFTWTAIDYEDIDNFLECEPELVQNHSYFMQIRFDRTDTDVLCLGATAASGVLKGFHYPSTTPVVQIPFMSQSVVRSPCFDSCNWPDWWEVTLTSGRFKDMIWEVGCCECEEYDAPCL